MIKISPSCGYTIIEEENKKYVECRTMMTSITLELGENNKSKDELEVECESFNEIYNNLKEKKLSGSLWDMLGYCGYMFFTEWLEDGYKYIMEQKEIDVMMIYIEGVKVVIKITDNYFLNIPT